MKARTTCAVLTCLALLVAGCSSDSAAPVDAAADAGPQQDTGTLPENDAQGSPDSAAPDTLAPDPGSPWLQGLGGAGSEEGAALGIDAQGNIYLAGHFSETVDFGDGPLTSQGEEDAFVVSYDAAGSLRWARQLGGPALDQGFALAVGGDAVLVAGGFDSATLDLGQAQLQNSGGEDIFLASLDLEGTLRWAKAFGGADHDRPTALAVDSAGHIALTGFFTGQLDLGGQTLATASDFDVDIFVARFLGDGTLSWAKRFGNGMYDRGRAITFDAGGGVIVAGEFTFGVDFGGGFLEGINFTDAFVASYAADGSYRWAKAFGGDAYDSAYGVAVDAAGQVVVVGQFGEYVEFGSAAANASGKYDAFLLGLDAAGGVRWLKTVSSPSPDRGYGAALDAAGNAYFTGSFQETAELSGGELQSAGGADVYLVSYASDGSYRFAERIGGPDYESGQGVAVGPAGEVAVCGYFAGELTGVETTVSSQGGRDAFLWRHVVR